MKIALAQMAPRPGDLGQNIAAAAELVSEAARAGADLVVFPELALSGYLIRNRGQAALRASDPRLTSLSVGSTDVLMGFHEVNDEAWLNSAAYVSGGKLLNVHRKVFLPPGPEDEFSAGRYVRSFDSAHGRLATLICYDMWHLVSPWIAAQDGAEVLLIPVNSVKDLGPALSDVQGLWYDLISLIARLHQCWVVFVNRVGSEEDHHFWGGSRVVDPEGNIVAQAAGSTPELVIADIDVEYARARRRELSLLTAANPSRIIGDLVRNERIR
ncbi:nitrilase-related carbon-nitrogen hydrolase [bacterium RCC_150]